MAEEATNGQVVEIETLSDDQLEEMVNPSSEPEDNSANSEPGEQVKQERPDETAVVPPTIDELQSQLEAANKRAEQVTSERDHWQKVRTDQEQNANAIRAAKEELQKRIEANRSLDPTQLFIDDPQKMMDVAAERAKLAMESEQIGQREQAYQHSQAVMRNAYQIDSVAPDLKDNMDGIVEMLKGLGDTPDAIQAFRNNPAMFPADKVHAINEMYRKEKVNAELQAQIERYKTRGTEQLQRVEQVAQHQPMTNAATGATANGEGSFPKNMSTQDISKLSDADLDAILAAARN